MREISLLSLFLLFFLVFAKLALIPSRKGHLGLKLKIGCGPGDPAAIGWN